VNEVPDCSLSPLEAVMERDLQAQHDVEVARRAADAAARREVRELFVDWRHVAGLVDGGGANLRVTGEYNRRLYRLERAMGIEMNPARVAVARDLGWEESE